MALCFRLTSSTLSWILSIFSLMSSTSEKNSSILPPSILTSISAPPSSSSFWAWNKYVENHCVWIMSARCLIAWVNFYKVSMIHALFALAMFALMSLKSFLNIDKYWEKSESGGNILWFYLQKSICLSNGFNKVIRPHCGNYIILLLRFRAWISWNQLSL